jgi:LPS export ABC transporter permease LptG/LPS export ABC transporter permease LptF
MSNLPQPTAPSSRSERRPPSPESLASDRRPGRVLYRYFAREMAVPMLFSLAGLTLVVLTQDLLGYTDLVINRGLGVWAVGLMAFYQAVALAARTLPFAVLLGGLIALGRLGADRELLAIEASGVSEQALVWPVMGFASGMAALAFGLSLFGAPWAVRTLDASLAEITRQTPSAVVRAGTVHRFGSWKLEAREVSSGGDLMRGVLLWMPERGETVFAERGSLTPTLGGSTRVTLRNGSVVPNPRDSVREIRFDWMSTELPESDQPIEREDDSELGGAKLAELLAWAERAEAPPDEVFAAKVELQRRFALPTATLVFGLVAVPLVLLRTRFSRSGGAMLGIAATVAYYGLVQLGTGLIEGGTLSVALGVWLPNLLFGAVAMVLVFRLGRRSAFSRRLARPSRQERRRSADAPASARVSAAPRAYRWAIQRYVLRRYLQIALRSFGVLLVAYLLIDLLERLEMFARYHASADEVIRYYAARLPLLASRVLPMSLLVASALTVGLLGADNELTGMRACGIYPPRALLPVIVLSGLIAPAFFLLDNEVVPRTTAIAHYLKNVEIRGRRVPEPGRAAVWYRLQDRVYEAERLDPQRGIARNIVVYELGDDGLPTSRTDARHAHYIGGEVWRLLDPVRVEISADGLEKVRARSFAELGSELPAKVYTRQLSIGELQREIQEIEAGGYDATPYRVDLWAKAVAPFTCLLLPALALFFALGGPPHPGVSGTLVFSTIVAVSYVLLTGVGASLGYAGAIPPAVAGAAPTVVFGLLTLYYGQRLRGFGGRFA